MSSHMFFTVQKCVWIVPFISSLGSKGEQPLWYSQHDYKEASEIFHQSWFVRVFPIVLHSQDALRVRVSVWCHHQTFQLSDAQWRCTIPISQQGLQVSQSLTWPVVSLQGDSPKNWGFQWVQDHVPHLHDKPGVRCSKVLAIIHCPHAHPKQQRAQLSPPGNIHNTLFTAVLGRPTHQKVQERNNKKKKIVSSPAGRNLPVVVHSKKSPQQSHPQATRDCESLHQLQGSLKRSLMNSTKNKTRGFTTARIRESQGAAHRPQGWQLPGPCGFLPGVTDRGQTGLDYRPEPIQHLDRWRISIHACGSGRTFINSFLTHYLPP